MKKDFKYVANKIERFFLKISEVDVLTQAAALALYTAFSLAPLMILLMSVLSTLKLELQYELLANVRSLMGNEAVETLNMIITASKERADLSSIAGWVGVITLLFSASAIFGQLQSSMNKIFEVPAAPMAKDKWHMNVHALVMKRLISFGMVLTFIFISIVSLVASSFMSMLLLKDLGRWGEVINSIATLVVFGFLFGAIFKWMPDRHISTRAAFKGGALTAVFFIFGKSAIGFYLGQTAIGSAYGAAGSLIVLLVWVYYSSLIVFCGAEIAAILEQSVSYSEEMA